MKNHLIFSLIVFSFVATLLPSCTDEPFDPSFNRKLWSERVAPMIEGCETDYEKAKAIYDWLCENIIYDYTYDIYRADECWENKTGVCQAFADLYVNLAKGCDLSAETIRGFARNWYDSDGMGHHAWNKVKTEKGWILLDATWGSCNGHADHFDNGGEWETYGEMRRIWFDVDPKWMIFTHFPENSQDQLNSNPVSRQGYLALPYITPLLGFWGWDAGSTLNYFLQHPQAKPPKTYLVQNHYWDSNVFLEYPFSMEEGEVYTIRIRNLNPEYPPTHGDWNVESDVYTCTASAGFTVRFGGHGIMTYPDATRYFPEEDLYTICYPSE